MRRAMVVSVTSLAGVVWLLTYKATPHTFVPLAQPGGPGGQPVTSPGGSPGSTDGTYTGQDVQTIFGDVQVQIVVSGGKVTDVRALQLPTDRERSAVISQYAGPMLSQEAIAAQSAQIDIISGATYTSEAYAQSLQSALQQAHLA